DISQEIRKKIERKKEKYVINFTHKKTEKYYKFKLITMTRIYFQKSIIGFIALQYITNSSWCRAFNF
ncbi:MAG: hypothetical protein AAGH81_18630, partial [Bacteroidota bacterium]